MSEQNLSEICTKVNQISEHTSNLQDIKDHILLLESTIDDLKQAIETLSNVINRKWR